MSIGERTLPQTIDEIASDTPDRIWARFPLSPEAFERGELHVVTYSILRNAINRIAWHLESLLGHGEGLPTLCYIGPSDVRYFIIAIAACKAGWKALFSSPRNNISAHLSLLDKTGCRVLCHAAEKADNAAVRELSTSRELRVESVPTLADTLDSEPVPHISWKRPFAEVVHEPLIVLHTSGSTGEPKPVGTTHGAIATIDAQILLPQVDDLSVTAHDWRDRIMYLTLPPFHSAAINFLGFSVFHGMQMIFGPSDKPPSLSTIDRMLDLKVADSALIAPSILAEIAKDEDMLPKLSRLSSVVYGGGPLPLDAAEAIWPYAKIGTVLGSTETYNLPELPPQSVEATGYHNFHPDLGIEFRLREGDLHELVWVRKPEMLRHQAVFQTFPELDEYPMKDLYEPHPSKPGLWKYRGRLDDIVVLSNGEKFNPVEAERTIISHAEVKSAMIVGQDHEQPALLVEPVSPCTDESERQGRRQSIVSVVEAANQSLPAHAQIHLSHVQVLDSPDSFLRSAKGEVRRAPTAAALNNDITKLYEASESNTACTSQLDFGDEAALTRSLQECLSSQFFAGNSNSIDATSNIFTLGFDSLRSLQLVRIIKSNLRAQGLEPRRPVATKVIYQHPVVHGLAKHLMQLLHGDDTEQVDDSRQTFQQMESLLEHYRARISGLAVLPDARRSSLPQQALEEAFGLSDSANAKSDQTTVVLTGSTGSLGSYVLDALIRNPAVSSVICLNRAGGTTEKQARANDSRGLTTDFGKVMFLECSTAEHHLGLSLDAYADLSQRATHIIHNAWPVDFNLPLSAFEPQLEACFRLIELAHASQHHAAVTFLSSVGAANNYKALHPDTPTPETMLEDFRVAEQMGYGQSKLLAELMFAHAGEALGLPVTVCRAGQIAGPVKSSKGMWNKNEWFPSLLLSCQALGKMPETLGTMDRLDWLPVDILSDLLADVALSAQKDLGNRPRQTSVSSVEEVLATPVKPTRSPQQVMEDVAIGANSANCRSLQSGVPSPRDSAYSSGQASPVPSRVEASASSARFLHFVSPNTAQWQDIAPAVKSTMDESLQLVPYGEWLQGLKEAEGLETESEVPAARLVDFYQGLSGGDGNAREFQTKATEAECPALGRVPAVSAEWVTRWVQQWNAASS